MKKLAVAACVLLAVGALEACLTGLGFTLCPNGRKDCPSGQVCAVDAGICIAPSTSTTGTITGTSSTSSTSGSTGGACAASIDNITPLPLAFASVAASPTEMVIGAGQFCFNEANAVFNANECQICQFTSAPYQSDAGLCTLQNNCSFNDIVGGSAFYAAAPDAGFYFLNGAEAGGTNEAGVSKLAAGTMSPLTTLQLIVPHPRQYATAVVTPGCTGGSGCVFLVGGLDDGGNGLPTDVLDLGTFSWVANGAAPLEASRCDLAAAYSPVDQSIYAVGGQTRFCGRAMTATFVDAGISVEVLRFPYDGGWIVGPPLPTAVSDVQVVGTDAGVYAIGGFVPAPDTDGYTATYLLDPNAPSPTWTSVGSLSAARWGHAAVLNPLNGHILVYGGQQDVAGVTTTVGSFEEYDPDAGWLLPQ